jgi:hypothetical protein
VGSQVFGPEAGAEIVVEGQIDAMPSSGSWRVSLVATRSDGAVLGRRELIRVADDCRTLDAALVLMVALILDPDARPQESARSAPPLQVSDPEPAMMGRQGEVVAAVAPIPRWRVGTSLDALAGTGILPTPSFGVSARLMLAIQGWPKFELIASRWIDHEVAAGAGGSRVSLWTAGVALCPIAFGGALISVCGGVHGGRLRSAGFGFDQNQDQRSTVGYASISLRATKRVATNLALQLKAELWAPWVRPRLFYMDADMIKHDVYQPWLIGGVLSAGFTAMF